MPADPAILAFLVIVLGAYFVGTVLGFGTTILAVTFGAQLIELDVLLPVVAPLNLALSAYIAVRHRRAIRWRLLLTRVLPLVGLGIPLGLALFNLRQVGWLRLVFGVFVAALAVLQLRTAASRSTARNRPLAPAPRGALLFLGGIVHGVYATAGPLLVYVLGRELDDKSALRSTLAMMFLPMTTTLLVDYAVLGLFEPSVIRVALAAVIPMLAGMWLGERAHDRIDERSFKLGVWLLLLAGGIVLSARAALAG